MPSKVQTHSSEKAATKQHSPQPTAQNIETVDQHPATIIQRARLDPSALSPRNALQLQRTIGNRAVGQLRAEMIQREAISGVIQRDVDEDLERLRQIMEELPPASPLAAILNEVIGVSADVEKWQDVPTSGSAVRGKTPGKYRVQYQMGKEDDERLGNLVHELTHVAVDKAYNRDFVNYVVDLAGKRRLTEEEWSARGYPSEGDYLLGSYWNDPEATLFLHKRLQDLIESAEASQLEPEQRTRVVDKLKYGQKVPQAEYDTVLNQILMWMHVWKVDPNDAFYQQIGAAVDEAHSRRVEGRELNVPGGGGEPPKKGKGKCYITTACVMARGLPDDCHELVTLRSFRDGYMRGLENGEALIQMYYQYAPSIVKAIDQRSNSKVVYNDLYQVIQTCVSAIRQEQYDLALQIYMDMVCKLQKEYTPDMALPSILLGNRSY